MLTQRLERFLKRFQDPARVDKGSQLLLALKYKELARTKELLPEFRDVGFRSYSQNDEDGIILYIFSLIGAESRYAVEIGAGTGMECNSANLILNHGWHALLVDKDVDNVNVATQFYSTHADSMIAPPKIAHAWVDRDNVNDLFTGNGFSGPVDLLSIDVDGNDYWIWEAITVVQPRVVIVECQPMWGAERAVTVPYDPGFAISSQHPGYHGASLPAFVKLGRRLGYRLVGANRLGFNAFFVQNGIGEDVLPEVNAAQCLVQPDLAAAREARLEKVRHLKWSEV